MAVRIMNPITLMGTILMVLSIMMVIIRLMMTTVQNNPDDRGDHANMEGNKDKD
jgi:hypothetical protein